MIDNDGIIVVFWRRLMIPCWIERYITITTRGGRSRRKRDDALQEIGMDVSTLLWIRVASSRYGITSYRVIYYPSYYVMNMDMRPALSFDFSSIFFPPSCPYFLTFLLLLFFFPDLLFSMSFFV